MTGRVIIAQQPVLTGGQETLIVDYQGKRITITGEEVILPRQCTTLKSLVGSEIDFIIINAVPEMDAIFASNKKAVEKIRKPVMEKLKKGKTVTATITKILDHGAYLRCGVIDMFIKNEDFSDDYNIIKRVARVGQKINVKLKKISESGKIFVEAESKYIAMCELQFSDYAIGQYVVGYVREIIPNTCFVRIGVGIDIMTYHPDFAEVSKGMYVQCVITNIKEEKRQLRGKIKAIL
jgi:small subunit ribosomal protein S1